MAIVNLHDLVNDSSQAARFNRLFDQFWVLYDKIWPDSESENPKNDVLKGLNLEKRLVNGEYGVLINVSVDKNDDLNGFNWSYYYPKSDSLCPTYFAVDNSVRGQGVTARRLLEQIPVMQKQLGELGHDMRSIVLQCADPARDVEANEYNMDNRKRLELFSKGGARWVSQIENTEPDYAEERSNYLLLCYPVPGKGYPDASAISAYVDEYYDIWSVLPHKNDPSYLEYKAQLDLWQQAEVANVSFYFRRVAQDGARRSVDGPDGKSISVAAPARDGTEKLLSLNQALELKN